MSCVQFSVAKQDKTAIGNEGAKSWHSGFHGPGHVGDHVGPVWSGKVSRRRSTRCSTSEITGIVPSRAQWRSKGLSGTTALYGHMSETH